MLSLSSAPFIARHVARLPALLCLFFSLLVGATQLRSAEGDPSNSVKEFLKATGLKRKVVAQHVAAADWKTRWLHSPLNRSIAVSAGHPGSGPSDTIAGMKIYTHHAKVEDHVVATVSRGGTGQYDYYEGEGGGDYYGEGGGEGEGEGEGEGGDDYYGEGEGGGEGDYDYPEECDEDAPFEERKACAEAAAAAALAEPPLATPGEIVDVEPGSEPPDTPVKIPEDWWESHPEEWDRVE